VCLLGWRIGAHRGEGAVQKPGEYPGEWRRLGLEGNDPCYTHVRAPVSRCLYVRCVRVELANRHSQGRRRCADTCQKPRFAATSLGGR
jgi:hypothetical protein